MDRFSALEADRFYRLRLSKGYSYYSATFQGFARTKGRPCSKPPGFSYPVASLSDFILAFRERREDGEVAPPDLSDIVGIFGGVLERASCLRDQLFPRTGK